MRSYLLVFPLVAIFANVAAGDLPPYCAANQTFGKGPEPAHLYKVICDVPLEALIANPDRYSGYFVQTDGFFMSEFHGDYLYPSCTAAQAGRLRAKITVSIASDNEDEPLEGFVHNVVGLFEANSLTIREARIHLLPPYDSSFNGCTFDQDM